ncbi:hypothetical protein DIPPA_04671 [Diplonema papillatum]|nr:hypothetical protein DIPPA_04671 [Diplonema papillatum]
MAARGIGLSLLSKLRVDVSKPILEWQLERAGPAKAWIVKHRDEMLREEELHRQRVAEVDAERKAAMQAILAEPFFDDVPFQAAAQKRAAEAAAAAAAAEAARRKVIAFRPKRIGRRVRFVGARRRRLRQERRELDEQRAALRRRDSERALQQRLTAAREAQSRSVLAARSKNSEINRLLKATEDQIEAMHEVSKRAVQSYVAEKNTIQAEERSKDETHFRRMEQFTSHHLERLENLKKRPDIRKRIVTAIDGSLQLALLVLLFILAYRIAVLLDFTG